MKQVARWMLFGGAVALGVCVLGLYELTSAAPAEQGPFANAVEQRMEMIGHLKETNALLKEQNALLKEQLSLLRSGQIKVIVTLPETGK